MAEITAIGMLGAQALIHLPVPSSSGQAVLTMPVLAPVSDLIGMPRQVMNCEPNIVTVAGGTPRRVHSRPKAAMASGWARKKPGSFQTRAINRAR